MGERTSYPHGTFSWVENATSDQDGANSFYSELFGWDYDNSPVGDGVYYSMAKLNDKYVAAIAPQQPDEQSMGGSASGPTTRPASGALSGKAVPTTMRAPSPSDTSSASTVSEQQPR